MRATRDRVAAASPQQSSAEVSLVNASGEPMRLLVLSSELPPAGYGSATALGEFLVAVEHHTDWRVHVVAPASRRLDRSPSWGRVRVHLTPCLEHADGLRHGPLRLARFPVDAVAQILRRQLTPSVILSWQLLPTGLAGTVLARRLGVPHVARLNGPELASRAGAAGTIHRLVVRRLLERADGVVAKAEQEIDAIRNAGYQGEAQLIPNATHASPSRYARAQRGPVRLLVVSRLVPSKAVGLVLDAMMLLESRAPGQFSVTIAGDGQQGAALRTQAQRCRLPVTFLGRVPREHMARLYADHDILVHPSEWEGSCNVALEALAAGLPVIGRWSALRDVVRDGEDGVLLPHPSPSELATVLLSRKWAELSHLSQPRQDRTGRELAADYGSLFSALALAEHP